ncbi:hypothetical protein KR215_003819, partial [Drosophila sulfurigaster]
TLHVVMLGLDSAGKTTALYRLKFDQYLNTVPTIGFNCEKVQGTIGKAKGVHFLVWDVGGQEKLRPLWRSYTRCTDGILFVVDSVDTERMEEAKMELMRTAKCPDNQGVPVLILANKQDLPNACCPNELEKLLGLHELQNPIGNVLSPTGTGSTACHSKPQDKSSMDNDALNQFNLHHVNMITDLDKKKHEYKANKTFSENLQDESRSKTKGPSFQVSISPKTENTSSQFVINHNRLNPSSASIYLKGWYIQPACAITGEGLQEGLNALYDMILKRRKINKSHKKNK